jgi:hypothetical protein
MTGSNPVRAGGVVFVTETDYVTVSLSMVESFTIDLSALTSATVDSSTMATRTSLVSSHMATSSFYSVAPSSSLLLSSAQASMTTVPALSSATVDPEHQVKSKPWNDQVAILSLIAIILVILLLLSLMVHIIYQRIRGECRKCVDIERQIEKYKNGELVHISPGMVQIREQSQATTVQAPIDRDVELGSSEQRDSHHQEALDKLNGPPQPAKVSIWHRTKGAAKRKDNGKAKGKRPQVPEPDEQRTNSGQVYTEADVKSVRHPTVQPAPAPTQVREYESHSFFDHAYSPPSPSIYSRPGLSDVSPPQEYFTRYGPPYRGTLDN